MGTTDKKFAKVLYHLIREEKRLKQAEVIKETGLPQSTVSAIMNGNRGTDKERREAIAKCFGMSVDEFLTYLDKEKPKSAPRESHIAKDNITAIHQDIIKQFIDKKKGLAANEALLIIEKHDRLKFIDLVADLEKIALKIQMDKEVHENEWDINKASNLD